MLMVNDKKYINFTVIALFGILLLLLTSMSCGIDTINYLTEDPVSISSDGTSSFIFSIKKPGSFSYLGVELFYRIYDSNADAIADKNYIDAKQSEINSVPGAFIESQLLSSSGLRYIAPTVDDSIKIPIISKDDVNDENDYIILSFPDYYISHDESTLFLLKRNVNDISGGGYKSFIDSPPVSGDPDYRTNTTETDTEYYVQFYAAAYGLDNNFEDLYGNAVYLGRITLNF